MKVFFTKLELKEIQKWYKIMTLSLSVAASLNAGYQVETIAGAVSSVSSMDGVGGLARFVAPGMMSIDRDGTLLIVDGNTIRKVTTADANYNVSTLFTASEFDPAYAVLNIASSIIVMGGHSHLTQYAWNGSNWASNNSLDSIYSQAGATGNYGIAIDSANAIYVTDRAQSRIWKILPDGSYSSFVQDNALSGLTGMAIDKAGNLYVAVTGNNTICKVTPAGIIKTIAGLAGSSGFSDGVGTLATFNRPNGIAIDASGDLYVVDQGNNAIRKLTNNADIYTVSTIAGLTGQSGSADGSGSAALFSAPTGIAVDRLGNIFVSDTNNSTIRRIFIRKLFIDFEDLSKFSSAVTGGSLVFTGSSNNDMCVFDGSATEDVWALQGKVAISSNTPIASGKWMHLSGGDLVVTAGFELPPVSIEQVGSLYINTNDQVSLTKLKGFDSLTIASLNNSVGTVHLADLSDNSGGIAACSQPSLIDGSTKFPNAACFFQADATVSTLPGQVSNSNLTFNRVNSSTVNMPVNGLTNGIMYALALNIGSTNWSENVTVH